MRLLLDRMGVSPQDLLVDAPVRTVPTFAEYLDRVAAAVSPATRRAYDTCWRRLSSAWGDRRLDDPTASDIKELVERTRLTAVVRGNSRGGRSAAENMITALRCVYKHAVADGLLSESANPAARVAKPRRLASTRRALSDSQLQEVVAVASTTGNDPHLDALLVRLHIETACRRGGALALRLQDLDPQQCVIRLREKGETVRWQPVSPTLMHDLADHAAQRGAMDANDKVLRYRNSKPITRRRYDYLWTRIGKHLPWVQIQQISTHWIRHTTLTWVERRFSYAVAKTFAGHTGRSDAGTTATYVRADIYEVALAVTALTGEPHPLAPSTPATL
ncbi:site-specific integrase [Dactylosporangium sp. NPDC049742]|uniref:tyrosine-type recombinase/integrase n=1 Tax=Dactylosporangium sp. NPDC049742 TaxID=3154737 RepID=UPI0034492285